MEGYKITNTSKGERTSCEIYFNSIPDKITREALKREGFRWHGVKKCWYGYTDPTTASAIIEAAAEDGAPLREGEKEPKTKAATALANDQNRIKIYWNGLRLGEGRDFVKCGYYKSGDTITIYADKYGRDLPRDLFNVENDTDIYTDYFDNDRARITPAHPLYKYIEFAAYKAEAHNIASHIKALEKRAEKYATTCPKYSAEYKAEAAKERARLAALEVIADPGRPTAADLDAIDKERQEEENRRRETERLAQIAEREKMLNYRAEGRRYVEAIAEQYPIEEGAPVVEIGFSECPAFYSWVDSIDQTRTEIIINADGSQEERTEIITPRRRCLLSVTAADIVLKHFDEIEHAKNQGYAKTDFYITWTDESGEPWNYEGRYDLGDNDGGLVEHIRAFVEWHKKFNRYGNEPSEAQKEDAEKCAAWVALLEKNMRVAA